MNRLKRPDIADRMIPGNWEGDLIIGKDGASVCVTLVERTPRYLIIVALPLMRRDDQVCEALTRRIHVLPEGAMRTLTRDQDPEMVRHQRLTPGTGVDVFIAHPHSPRERETNDNTSQLIRRYLPTGTPITSHQPYLDAIADEPGNCPRVALGYRTPPQKHSTNSLLLPIDAARFLTHNINSWDLARMAILKGTAMGLFGMMLSAFTGGNNDVNSSSEYYETDVCPRCGEEMHKRYSYSRWHCPSCGGPDDDEDEDIDDSECLDVNDAADIWMSNGMDEDYTFGYSEEELREALGEGSW